jgi:thiol:disulfide interchange protein
MLPTIIEIKNMFEFKHFLENNPGLLIISLSATWCVPCSRVKGQIEQWFTKMPDNIQTISIDIDKSTEVYTYLKKKKMLKGVPAILCFNKRNKGMFFDHAINTSNKNDIDEFFYSFKESI